jgi:diguanylate cyclase (GGDEF)-like protein/PAS domain S-box-containing protein
MREALEQAGFEVVEVEDGSLALQAFVENSPDVILLDVEMPKMDGFSACAALRRLPQAHDTPILMVTGHDDVESVHRAFEVGATDFQAKPINWALLGYRVRYILRSSRTYRALKDSEARLAKAQQMARLGHWDWDVRGDRWYFSESANEILGLVQGNRPANRDDLLKLVHPDDRDQVKQCFGAALRGEEKYRTEYRLTPPEGPPRVISEQAEVQFDTQAQPEFVEGTLQDVTERRQAEERIRYLAYFDGLTGLPNRQMFTEQVARSLRQAQRTKRPHALLFLDLDNFKSINDTLGHSVGDKVVQQVAQRLSLCVRSGDLVCRPVEEHKVAVFRFGGDEFALLLFDLQREHDAAVVAQRIKKALEQPFQVGSYELFATASLGIALYPSDGEDVETLLRNADSAMYQAKQKGKNRYEFYTESLTQVSVERMNMEGKLRRAVEQNELKLCFQPKVETQSGRLTGAEALLRWDTADLGSVSPAKFIPLAEETALIIPIGEWVLNEACTQMRAWEAVGLPPLTVAVNLSARQFQHSNLAKFVSDLLSSTGLRPHSLELELTESAIMADVEKAKLTLHKLSELGVRLSIDDFGTGYSSLNHLRWLPLNALKIDKSFVRDVPVNENDSAITLAIIAMAHSLGLRVVAEGVDRPAQFDFLKAHGCDEVQGYLFSPPLPPQEFVQFSVRSAK